MAIWTISTSDAPLRARPRAQQQEYSIRQAAYLPVEGVGVNGTFFVRGSIAIRGHNLFVSAMGYSAPMDRPEHSGAYTFHGRASLMEGRKQIFTQQLGRETSEIWPLDQYTPVGSSILTLPSAQRITRVSLEIEVSYTYSSSSGSAVPMPQFAKTSIPLEVSNQ